MAILSNELVDLFKRRDYVGIPSLIDTCTLYKKGDVLFKYYDVLDNDVLDNTTDVGRLYVVSLKYFIMSPVAEWDTYNPPKSKSDLNKYDSFSLEEVEEFIEELEERSRYRRILNNFEQFYYECKG